MKSKGVSFLIVISILLIFSAIAVIAMNIIRSHTRLTHHQVSRLQAYYAAQAGVIYALEMLRTGAWDENDCNGAGCTYNDADFPACINLPGVGLRYIRIVITPDSPATPGNTHQVSATAEYTLP